LSTEVCFIKTLVMTYHRSPVPYRRVCPLC